MLRPVLSMGLMLRILKEYYGENSASEDGKSIELTLFRRYSCLPTQSMVTTTLKFVVGISEAFPRAHRLLQSQFSHERKTFYL